jgi:hypothetical protein
MTTSPEPYVLDCTLSIGITFHILNNHISEGWSSGQPKGSPGPKGHKRAEPTAAIETKHSSEQIPSANYMTTSSEPYLLDYTYICRNKCLYY